MNTLPHLFVLATLGLTSFALAAPITTYRFSGTVSAVGSNLGSTVQVGNAYAADFTFDEAIALQFNFGNFALYKNTLSEIRITSTGSGLLTWSASDPLSNDINNGFTIDNNSLGRDAITFSTGPGQLLGPALNGESVVSHSFNLTDGTQTAFSSAGIPAALSPASFATKVLTLTFDGNLEADTIRFNLVQIEKNPSAIPEPATSTALVGLLVLGFGASRRSRR